MDKGLLSSAPLVQVLTIAGLALLLHFLVRALQRVGEWIVTPASSPGLARELLERRRPKVATLTTLTVSAATFAIYFIAVGMILNVFEISLTAYFASATVIALAVGFGSQGLVQDVVIGVTLVFSDAFDVGDIIEVSGQVGRVERIGLRFTTLSNFMGQTVYLPNRNIGVIGRYRGGAIRAYADVQLSPGHEEDMIRAVRVITGAMRAQQPAIVLVEPEITGPFPTAPQGWSYIRVMFKLWPGQNAYVDTTFRQRCSAAMKRIDDEYADWMLTVSFRTVAAGADLAPPDVNRTSGPDPLR